MTSQHTAKSFVIFGSQIISLGLRFLSNIILAWLLVPADFGVAAVVFTIITGIALFGDVGIYDALIRHQDGNKTDFLKTAQTLTLVRGIVLYSAVFIISPFAEEFFSIPGLTLYLRVASINLLFMGLGSVRIINLQRNMQVLPGIIIDLCAQVLSILIVIALAYQYRTVWPLVLSSAISTFIILLLSQLYKPSLLAVSTLNSRYVKDVLSFGKWILLSTLFTFFIINSDRLILARISDMTTTGLYNLGLMLGSIIFVIGGVLTEKLIFPELARLSRANVAGDELDRTIEKTLRGFMPIVLISTLIIFVCSPLFFRFLYADTYLYAGFVAQVMVLVSWFMLLYAMLNKTFIAMNQPKIAAGYSFLTSIIRIILCLVGYQKYGMLGFMIGLGAGSLIGFILEYIALRKRFGFKWIYSLSITAIMIFLVGIYFIFQMIYSNQLNFQLAAVLITFIGSFLYLYKIYAARGFAFIKARNR